MPFDAETKVRLTHIDSDTKFGAVYYLRRLLNQQSCASEEADPSKLIIMIILHWD